MHELTSQQWFYCFDGTVIRSLGELAEELRRNTKGDHLENLSFHVKEDKDDYSTWIANVLNIPDLSKSFRVQKGPEKKLKALEIFIEKNPEYKDDLKPLSATDEEVEPIKSRVEEFARQSDKLSDSVQAMKNKEKQQPTQMADEMEEISEKYRQLYSDISDSRKEGVDVFIPSLMLKNIKPKIDYFGISRSIKDYEHIMKLLKSIENELEDCRRYKPIDVKEEILQAAGKKEETEE